MKSLTIATRGSRLALWQTEHVIGLIRTVTAISHPDLEIHTLTIKTKGDEITDLPLSKVGGKGLFVKEIEEALLDGRADLAVHSMKDMPMQLPPQLLLAAVPERGDPADVMLSATYRGSSVLPSGAVVGTSSLRRQAQFLAFRPDVRIESLRGNVDTRLRKMQEGQYDAIILAAAGVNRLGLKAPYMEPLQIERFLPAAGQGALGLEIRADHQELLELLAPLDHLPSRLCVEAERGFLYGLDGDCQVPVAAHAVQQGEDILLHGLVAHTDGSTVIRRELCGKGVSSPQAAWELGLALAERIIEDGGRSVLNTVLYGADLDRSNPQH